MIRQRLRELSGLLSGAAVLLAAGPALAIDMPWSFPKDSGTWMAAAIVGGVITVGIVVAVVVVARRNDAARAAGQSDE